MADNDLKINTGTALTMASDDISSVHYPRYKLSVGADGAAADWAGTIGTVAVLEKGTISAGTVDQLTAGTVDTVGLRHADTFGTVVSHSATSEKVVKTGVAGSQLFITDLIVSVDTATNVVFGDGGTENPILGTLHFGDDGGMVSNFRTPISTTAGSALVFEQSAAVDITVTALGYVD